MSGVGGSVATYSVTLFTVFLSLLFLLVLFFLPSFHLCVPPCFFFFHVFSFSSHSRPIVFATHHHAHIHVDKSLGAEVGLKCVPDKKIGSCSSSPAIQWTEPESSLQITLSTVEAWQEGKLKVKAGERGWSHPFPSPWLKSRDWRRGLEWTRPHTCPGFLVIINCHQHAYTLTLYNHVCHLVYEMWHILKLKYIAAI